MVIKYDKKGRILSCSTEERKASGKYILEVSDETLPEDFLEMFALGKYYVRKNKIAENKKFKRPAATEMPFVQLTNEVVQKTKKRSKNQKSRKRREE